MNTPLKLRNGWLLLLAFLVACNGPGETVEPGSPVPASLPPATASASETPTGTASAPSATPAASATTDFEIEHEEAILILEPGPGARATSPLHVSGQADPAFEQLLGWRLVLDDGELLAEGTSQIQADVGQRGPFNAEIEFELQGERQALLQVYRTSPRDGGVTHLASVGVILSSSGPDEPRAASAHPERIQIQQPAQADTISGGMLTVSGQAVASFEGTLVVELYDADGGLLASMPVVVDAPEPGQMGSFEAQLTYIVAGAQPGRVVVLDPLPAFDGRGHLSSLEITLEP
jgi:hypothetical protein